MPAAPDLALLERWFQAEVLRPHVRSARVPTPAARHLTPSRALSAAQRIGIYQRGYMLRLRECLESDFQAVRRIAGDARFAALVRAYLERHPSRHWSLNPLGRDFARFLEREAPRGPRHALLVGLARLEWAMQEVFEAPRAPVLAHDALQALAPEAWARIVLVPIPALRLVACEQRCNAIASAVRRDEPLPPLGRKRTWVAVYRKDWAVWRMDLDELQFTLLAALCRGRTLGQALAAAARRHRGAQSALQSRIQSACANFMAEGLFQSVR